MILDADVVLERTGAKRLEDVEMINLWGQNFSDVSIITQMPNVSVLSLSANRIHTLHDFASCLKLRELYLRKNCIRDLNEVRYLRSLHRLRILWLSENDAAHVDGYRLKVIKALPQLVVLDNMEITEEERHAAKNSPILMPAAHTAVYHGSMSSLSSPPSSVSSPSHRPHSPRPTTSTSTTATTTTISDNNRHTHSTSSGTPVKSPVQTDQASTFTPSKLPQRSRLTTPPSSLRASSLSSSSSLPSPSSSSLGLGLGLRRDGPFSSHHSSSEHLRPPLTPTPHNFRSPMKKFSDVYAGVRLDFLEQARHLQQQQRSPFASAMDEEYGREQKQLQHELRLAEQLHAEHVIQQEVLMQLAQLNGTAQSTVAGAGAGSALSPGALLTHPINLVHRPVPHAGDHAPMTSFSSFPSSSPLSSSSSSSSRSLPLSPTDRDRPRNYVFASPRPAGSSRPTSPMAISRAINVVANTVTATAAAAATERSVSLKAAFSPRSLPLPPSLSSQTVTATAAAAAAAASPRSRMAAVESQKSALVSVLSLLELLDVGHLRYLRNEINNRIIE